MHGPQDLSRLPTVLPMLSAGSQFRATANFGATAYRQLGTPPCCVLLVLQESTSHASGYLRSRESSPIMTLAVRACAHDSNGQVWLTEHAFYCCLLGVNLECARLRSLRIRVHSLKALK